VVGSIRGETAHVREDVPYGDNVLAHRGAPAALYPENTVEAVTAVRLTVDATLDCCHDPSVTVVTSH
jgi:hypothetical protein